MKQSTFSAVMANSIKNLLQGYTKGIRFTAILTMLFTVGVGSVWGEELAVNDVLFLENFKGGSSSTTFSAQTYSTTYSSVTMKVSEDASSISRASSNACFRNTSAANMSTHHAWLNKGTTGYVEIDNIPLHNVTKFQASWAQSAKVAVTFYYKFNGATSWTSGGASTAAANASATSNIITVPDGKTSVSIKFQRANNSTNQRIDNLKITVTEVAAAADPWELRGSFDSWGSGVTATEASGIATVALNLAASTAYEFKFVNGSSWYGNTGAIITDISGWVFSTSVSNNARLYTGPAGTYTFKINTSNKQVQVIYPTVTHPAEGYAYFQKQDSWTGFKVYNYTDDNNRLSDWDGSPAVTNTTTICGKTYYYTALATQFQKVIFRDNGTNQWKEIYVSEFSGKYCGDNYNETPQTWKTFNKYSITFNSNGGSGTMSTISGICPGDNQTLPANTFTRTGYTFDGWATSANGNKVYNDEATISNINSNITLYARWKANIYTITSNLTNCSSSPAIPASYTYTGSAANLTFTITPNSGYQLPTSVTVSGSAYTWDNATGQLTLTGIIKSDVAITVTAIQFVDILWYVNGKPWNDKGGSSSIEKNETYQDLTLPTAPGDDALEACYPEKVFVGWSTQDLGYEETTEPDDLFTSDNVPATEITENKTFYAVFATKTDGGTTTTSKSTTLDFSAQGYSSGETVSSLTIGDITAAFNKGSNSNDPKYYTSGTAVRVYGGGYFTVSGATGCTITKVEITFGSSDGSNAITTNAGTYSNGTWTGSASSVKFTVGGTSGNRRIQSLSVTYSTTTASPASYSGYVSKCNCVTGIALSMTGGQHKNLDVGETNQLLVTYTPEEATCDKEIVSWTSSNDNILSVSNTGLVTANMAGEATITATTEGGVTATYTITVNNPDCEAWYIHYWNNSTSGDECFYKVKPDDPNDHEWRTGNFSLPSFSNEDMFIVNNAQAAGGDSQKTDQIFRTGIGFADIQRGGQYCGPNPYPGQDAYGQLSIYDDSNSSNRYIAFYPAQYMVTFGKEGSSWEEMPLNNTTGYEYESEPFMVPNGYKTDEAYKYWVGITDKNGNIKYVGYEFDGVEYKKSSVDAMNTVNGLSSTSDMAGKWGVWHIWSNSCANNWYCEFIHYYRVDFNLNGGEGDIAPRYGKTTTPYVTFSTSDITPPTRDGYTFLGWEDQKGTTYNPTESTVTINDDLTLTAQWAQNHTLTYDLAGGDGTACDVATTYYTGQSFTVCSGAGEKTGYTFNGWLGSDGNTYNAGGTYTMPDEDLTITAQWTRDTYTITWNVAGEETTTTIGTGDPVVLPAETPTSCSDTYTTFVGWYTAASGMETSPSTEPQGEQVTASTIPTGSATYYAVWADATGGGEWEKVTSFEIGDVVIFVNETSSKEMSDINLIISNTCGIASSYTTNPVGTYPLTIEAGNNETGYSFKTSDNTYLSWSSGNTLIKSETKNDASSWTIHSNTDGNFKFANIGTAERIMQYNTSSPRWACYTSGQTAFQIYKQASSATGYISSCCQSPAVVTVTPADASLELNIDGTAFTTVNISQTGGGNGKYYEPTVSPADGASLNWAALGVTFKQTAYDINFTATKAGTYTITGNFTETSYGCQKTGSATINVVANPILQVSAEELEFSPTCGQNSVSQEVEINSRYLTANSITATVATTSGSGKFTISTDNTTFGTSNLTLSGGIATKVTDQIYVRYEAIESETGNVAGTLTLKCGSTQQVINLTGTCTCSANVTITGNPIQITAANGIWVEASHELTATGTFLTTNADNANVSIRAYTNNAAFQIKTGGTTGEGTANALTLGTNISNPDWTGNIGIVYKPTQANTTETATLTVEVYRHNGSTIYSTATYELEGRSLPEQFVIAVTNGSDDWFAVPADMIAPWGDACSGLGTFAPYPISVDNATAPTEARDVPARAIYQAAARTGNVNTNPQTMSYKSVPLGGNYYLYGSSTSVDSDGNNTNIQNASFAASEKQKWFLDVVDWNTKQYNMHVHSSLTTNVLAYTTAGGANRVGQYSATAGTTKKSIYLLPISGTTCTYYAAPVVEVTAIDATNATIEFKNDRTTAYEISLDQNTWTDLSVTLIKDCNNSEEATQLQAQLPLATYRGKTVYIRAKVTTGTACQETGSFVVPNPTIDRGETPWKYTGMAGQAFSDNSKSITISDLWNPLSVSVVQQVTGSNIQASITPEGVVTVSMAAEDATEGDHKAVLEFTSAGAETKQVGVVITLHNLALQEFDGGDAITFTETSPIMLCKNAIDENDATPTIYLSYPLYKDGDAISSTSELNETEFTLIDINTGSELSFSREGSVGGIAKITLNETSRSSMIPGHTYRLSWENTNQVMTNMDGLPYMDCYMDFIYSENCDAPTALAACPITNSSFTANWVPVTDCTGNVTVDVYTKAEGTTMWSIDYTQKPTLNVWTFAGLSGMQEAGGWYCDETSSSAQISYTTAGIQIAKASTYGQLYSPTFANMANVPADLANTEVTISITHISNNGNSYKFRVYAVETTTAKADVPYEENTMYDVYFNGSATKSRYLELTGSGSEETTSTITIKGLTSTSHILLYGNQSTAAGPRIKQFAIKNSTTKTSVATQTLSCSAGSAEFTGLSANTTYYYTVTDGSSNTSNEIAVTTYNGVPELKFYSDEACTTEITETTVLGGEETTVYVKGTRVPACAINASVSTGYGMDDSGINYTTGTGVVSGSVILTLADANTTEGTLTITDAEGNDYVLNIVSSDCPAGFGTMALPATNITNESAQANWRNTLDFGDDKSGTLQLYKNGIVNRELIVNGDFETGSLDAGWSNGINNGEVGAAHSFDQYTIKNSSSEAHNGSYSLYVTAAGSTLTNFQGQSVMYADYITLTPGTYRMSAWVKMPTANGYDDKMQYFSLGIITGKNGSEHVYTVSTPVTVYSNNTYVQLTHEFEVTSTITACPAIGASSGTFRYFYLDDVSLVCTSIGQSDEPYLSIDIADLSAGNLALTDLSGNTEYTYVIQNADGCSSNPITFQTTEAGAPVITPNDVAITCQVGNSTNGIMTLTVKDVYSDIYISNSCTERITLKTTQLPKEGGVVNFTFTPLNTDQGGETGTCTISFTTKGLSTPATGIITWTVTAGVDPDLPIIDVTDITNTSLNIEHNVEGDGVQIVISRERQEDEIEDNIGEEIFFSKYYEAYMHKKLWAIYNPTKEKISLKNTYVWRSNGKGTDWNIEGGLDLSQMGNIESGYIYPNEELIVYTSDQVGECEQSKADMTNWVAMSSSDPALSFSGNDALLLVRKDIDGDADNPPTESVELDSNGDPYELSWRRYTDAGGQQWWMLDIIGARQPNNKPDITATGSWTWNCNGKTEKGDADGWYGDQGEHLNATLYKDCGYVLSTNRCLLIRKESVKSGYKAINDNVGDMVTLGKNHYPTEWRGAHVPQDGNQEETSCENFTYVGGYDYESYYNAWTDLDNLQPAVQQPDGSWLVEGVDVPNFYCHPLLIEVLITDVVNGEEVENVSAYLEYKVPIVVDEDAKTNDTRYFVEPTPENVLSPEICAECDVVIRDGAKLTHIEDGRAEFRTMQVYPTGRLDIPEGLTMQLEGLQMYAKNDEVGYAIINGSTIEADNIVHIKRIDDMYWYPFSLPYDCKVSSIYQLNGKSMGEYWTDWGIKYYDGEARQQEGDNYAGGATSKFWKKLDASETLKAHQGYIIGLFTTEWQGQMKSIYFPPVESTKYSENAVSSKTTYISNWPDNFTCEPRHRGWNFTGLPYISLFSSQNGDGTTNNTSLMMGSQTDDYATSSIVYVSIPDGGDSRTYTQVSAASVKLEPFKPYFVQAMDPTDGQPHNDIALTYSKGGRTLEKIQARSAASTQATIIVELVVTNADATLTDNAGVLVSDRYTENYEIAADLMKMYAEDRKPQLFTRAINNEMMAYNALPDHLAQNIPLGLFVPTAGEYTISILEYASQFADAEAVYLLYNGEIVANLLYADYIVQVQQAGLINGYSLDIRRKQKTTTDINNLTDGAPVITIVEGQIVIQQLPDNAEVQIIDVLGRVLYQQANVPDIITFQAPATGVYNVVITTTEQQFTHKTIIR